MRKLLSSMTSIGLSSAAWAMEQNKTAHKITVHRPVTLIQVSADAKILRYVAQIYQLLNRQALVFAFPWQRHRAPLPSLLTSLSRPRESPGESRHKSLRSFAGR